jgi:hypothetical protein
VEALCPQCLYSHFLLIYSAESVCAPRALVFTIVSDKRLKFNEAVFCARPKGVRSATGWLVG